MTLPGFLIVGAPKAGSTALHEALAPHPQLFLSSPKEPKFFLCDGRPPDRRRQRGPGDAHSAKEWVWRRSDYESLFDAAPVDALCGESTPFYLWDKASHARIKAMLPVVKLVAVVRDPIDRAYSNWAHLWCDGLEPEADFVTAFRRERERIEAGYAPFWRYGELGRYGEQLAHLYTVFDRSQVFVLRYRELVTDPQAVLDRICVFLGIEPGVVHGARPSNVKYWVPPTRVNRALRRVVRGGAFVGAAFPPRVWRTVEGPLLRVLHRGGGARPRLTVEQRAALLPYFAADIALLEHVTGESFADWRRETGRGAFVERIAAQGGQMTVTLALDGDRHTPPAGTARSERVMRQLVSGLSAPAELVVDAPGRGAGFWAGGPSVWPGDDGLVYLAYRLRRPVEAGRGFANCIARSVDGIRFEHLATVTMEQLNCASLERPALVQRPDGGWRVYLSCSTPGSKHWWVEALDADTPQGLAAGRRTVVLPGDAATAWKDVVVRRSAGGWQMWACRHLLDRGDDEADRMDSWFLTSADGLDWAPVGRALQPTPGTWDARGARITAVLPAGGGFVAAYDGRASAAENWYERTGLAISDGPTGFAAAAGPITRGGRTLRYLAVLPVADGLRLYFEADRPDGSNGLYTTRVADLDDLCDPVSSSGSARSSSP